MAKCIFVWRPRQLSHAIPSRAEEGRRRRPLNVESMIYRRLYPRSTVICLPCQFVKGTYPRVQSVYNELSSSRHVASRYWFCVEKRKPRVSSLSLSLPLSLVSKLLQSLYSSLVEPSLNLIISPSLRPSLTF